MIMTTNSEVFRSSGGLEGSTERSGAVAQRWLRVQSARVPFISEKWTAGPHPLVRQPEDEPKAD